MTKEQFRKRIANELRQYRKIRDFHPLPQLEVLEEGEQYKVDLDGVEFYLEPSESSTGRHVVWSAVAYDCSLDRECGDQIGEHYLANGILGLAKAVVKAQGQLALVLLAEAQRHLEEAENAEYTKHNGIDLGW